MLAFLCFVLKLRTPKGTVVFSFCTDKVWDFFSSNPCLSQKISIFAPVNRKREIEIGVKMYCSTHSVVEKFWTENLCDVLKFRNFALGESEGTERNGTERNGTERNGTERNGTERNHPAKCLYTPFKYIVAA